MLSLAGFMFRCFTNDDEWVLWSPMMACFGFMSLVWIGVLANASVSGRKFAVLCWLILMVGVARVYYLTVILNGKAVDHICEEHLEQVSEVSIEAGITDETITV